MSFTDLLANPKPLFAPSKAGWDANPFESNPFLYSTRIALFGIIFKFVCNINENKALFAKPGYFVVFGAIGYLCGFPVHAIKKQHMLSTEKLRDRLVMQRMHRLHHENKNISE